MDIPDRVFDELVRQGQKEANRDKIKIRLERITMWAVIFYGGVAFLTWIALLRSNSINIEALTSVQRAFITFANNFHGRRFINGQNIILFYMISPILENSGVTPATEVTGHISGKIFNGDLPNNYTFPDLSGDNGGSIGPTVFGPKLSSEIRGIKIQLEDMRKLVFGPGQWKLVIWGWITYRDIFKETSLYRTEFCSASFVVAPAVLSPDSNNEMVVTMAQCRQHNCVDKTCHDQYGP